MTTFEAIGIGFREASRAKKAAVASRSGTRTRDGVVTGFFRRLGGAFFTLCALAAFTYAAFSVASWLGFVVLGVSLLIAEWRVQDDSSSNEGRG